MRTIVSSLFVGRLTFALIVIFALYNASTISYYHWVSTTPFEGMSSPAGFGKVLVGAVFLVAFLFFFISTWRAPAKPVYLGILVIVIAFVWWMSLNGWVSLSNPTIGTGIAQILVAFALALGSLWSKVWNSRTGQKSVEDQDTGGTE